MMTVNPKTFVIAEAGVNHNGSIDLAKELVDAAAESGADAVKFQTFHAEQLTIPDTPTAKYQRYFTTDGKTQREMLKQLQLNLECFLELQNYCTDKGVMFLSTPFDEPSVDYLGLLGMPIFKIGSGDLTNSPFLKRIAKKGKPIILSTGMSYLGEVEEAVLVLRECGCEQLTLLHCVSCYPANPADVNLRTLETLTTAFQIPVGYSDHTLGIEIALAAVALGACVIEKHITLDRTMLGPDHSASLEPSEFKDLVRGIRVVEKALGCSIKQPQLSELDVRQTSRRSLVPKITLEAGEILRPEMLTAKRPGTGIAPSNMRLVVGRRLRKTIEADQVIGWEHLQ